MKALNAAKRSAVKILSSRQPTIHRGKLKGSSNGNVRTKVALISELDTSQMKTLDRTETMESKVSC